MKWGWMIPNWVWDETTKLIVKLKKAQRIRRDIAARNILVADNYLADFALTWNMPRADELHQDAICSSMLYLFAQWSNGFHALKANRILEDTHTHVRQNSGDVRSWQDARKSAWRVVTDACSFAVGELLINEMNFIWPSRCRPIAAPPGGERAFRIWPIVKGRLECCTVHCSGWSRSIEEDIARVRGTFNQLWYYTDVYGSVVRRCCSVLFRTEVPYRLRFIGPIKRSVFETK